MTTILIARPEAEGQQTAARLQAKGYETILTPVLEIVPIKAALPAGAFQAILVTSAHAAPWLAAQASVAQSTPVLAVGDRTAAILREAGFANVRSASGDRVALAALVRGAVAKDAAILAPVGRDHHTDIPDGLRAEGYRVEAPVVYAANFADALSAEAIAALRYDVADGVLHYSARSAAGFMSLVNRADIDPASLQLRHICLSQQVADALPASVRDQAVIAKSPDDDAMMKAVAEMFAPETAGSETRPKSRKSRARAFAIDAKAIETADKKPAQETVETAPAALSHANPAVIEAAGEKPSQNGVSMPAKPAEQPAPAPSAVPPARVSDAAPPPSGQQRAASPAGAKPQAMSESREAPEPRARRSGLSLLGAGLLGGLLGGAAALFIPPYLPKGWLPEPKGPDIAGSVAAQVRSELAARPLAPRADLDALKQTATQQAQAVTGLQNGLADTNRKLGDVEKLVRTAPDQAVIAQQQMLELSKRVDLLDGVAKVPYDIVGLSKRVDDLAARKSETAPDLAPLAGQLAAANAAIAQLQAKLDALAAKPAPDTSRPVRIHALAMGIMGAMQRGAPFKAEYDAVLAAGVPAAAVQPLQSFADKGAPGGAALAKAFETVAPKILQAVEPPPAAQSGFWDKLKGMAGNMVRIRPVGQAAGDTPAGQVGRIEAALPRGAFADALRAWQALPLAGQAASAEFGAVLKARAEADAAGRAFVDEATRALARQGQ